MFYVSASASPTKGDVLLRSAVLGPREQLEAAAAEANTSGRNDRLSVWIELGTDDCLRATLAIDSVCAKAAVGLSAGASRL